MPRPSEVREPILVHLDMGARFAGLWTPADTQKSGVDATCFAAWKLAHRKRIDLGGFFTRSVRSAITRKARAITATSASFLVVP